MKLTNPKDFKELKTVVVVRTKSLYSHHGGETEVSTADVVAVGRRYVTLMLDNNRENKFCPVDGLTEDSVRSEYTPSERFEFYADMEQYEAQKKMKRSRDAVALTCRNIGTYDGINNLTDEEVLELEQFFQDKKYDERFLKRI